MMFVAEHSDRTATAALEARLETAHVPMTELRQLGEHKADGR